jgi:putative membrane protein insertion efficiency factor
MTAASTSGAASSTARTRVPPGASLPARAALVLIRVYKIALSPLFAGSCRYMPGCADYMTESIARFGFLRGGWLGTRRVCRCHPFGGHGYDPVPDR